MFLKVPLLKGDLGGSRLGKKGGDRSLVKVPLLKGDLGGSRLDDQREIQRFLTHIPHPQLAHRGIEGGKVNHPRQK